MEPTRNNARKIVVVGGGAAGFFAAITCAGARPDLEVTILERSAAFLGKVRISGGGRCNVTHHCFDTREFAARYPRGGRALLSAFSIFNAADTVAWFAARGVRLKAESDGRMFPVTDDSATIVDCLMNAAQSAGVRLQGHGGVEAVRLGEGGRFHLTLSDGRAVECDRLLLATGGCRSAAAGALAASLGHSLAEPVPSLFTFTVAAPWVRQLAGIAVERAEVGVPGTPLKEEGALLLTHHGLSGPAVLRLSAWGARALHALDYQFTAAVNWLPRLGEEAIGAELDARRHAHPARLVVNTPLATLPARLWEQLVLLSGVEARTRWAEFSRPLRHGLIQQLRHTALPVSGKSLNKDEFVTCGGVKLSEVDFKTMESRITPGLYFAGELLDVDGITGGFNFQAAWTTGFIAGRAMAG